MTRGSDSHKLNGLGCRGTRGGKWRRCGGRTGASRRPLGRVSTLSTTKKRHPVPSGVSNGSESFGAEGPWPRESQAPTQKLIALRPSSYLCACSKRNWGFKTKVKGKPGKASLPLHVALAAVFLIHSRPPPGPPRMPLAKKMRFNKFNLNSTCIYEVRPADGPQSTLLFSLSLLVRGAVVATEATTAAAAMAAAAATTRSMAAAAARCSTRSRNGGAPRMRRSAGPKAAGTTYATIIAARRGLGEVTAGTLSPRGKRGEVKNPPLLKPWSLLHL